MYRKGGAGGGGGLYVDWQREQNKRPKYGILKNITLREVI